MTERVANPEDFIKPSESVASSREPAERERLRGNFSFSLSFSFHFFSFSFSFSLSFSLVSLLFSRSTCRLFSERFPEVDSPGELAVFGELVSLRLGDLTAEGGLPASPDRVE